MTMDDKDTLMRWVHESEVARLERVIKRLWILCIIIFVAFVVSNAMWIRYENQYEDVVTETQTVTQESGDGGSNTFTGDFISGDYNGETNSHKDNN